MTLVVFAGNIGAGKTTVASALAQSVGIPLVAETVTENPYLSLYYSDMSRWAFNLAAYNLQDRAKQLVSVGSDRAVIDRSIFEDRHIFVRLQSEYGFMSDDDFATYCKLWDLIVPRLRPPDLLVFLDSPIDLCIERIKIRNRSMESGIPHQYMVSLDQYYSEWISAFNQCPVLRIHVNEIDYLQELNIVQKIKTVLGENAQR